MAMGDPMAGLGGLPLSLVGTVRSGKMPSNALKIRCPLTKSAALPNGNRRSIKGPITVPVSPSNAVKCYPCREVTLNYHRSLLFHGGDTGSTPVRDAKNLSIFAISTDTKQMKRFLMDLSVNGCDHSANLSLVESYVSCFERRHVAAVLRREHGRANLSAIVSTT
jgi:hypothetical protein